MARIAADMADSPDWDPVGRRSRAARPGREDDAKAIIEKWELDFAVVGYLTDTGHMVLRHKGEIVAEASTESDELLVHACDLDDTVFGKQTIFDFVRHRRFDQPGMNRVHPYPVLCVANGIRFRHHSHGTLCGMIKIRRRIINSPDDTINR